MPKIYSFLVDDISEHKEAKGLDKHVVAAIIHSEYNYVLLNHKYLRHSINRIQNKNHRIGTYGINRKFLSCFDDKIHIINDGCDELALGYCL